MLGFVLDALLAALEDVAAELVLESVESTRTSFESSESVESVESAVDSEGSVGSASLLLRTTTFLTAILTAGSSPSVPARSVAMSKNILFASISRAEGNLTINVYVPSAFTVTAGLLSEASQ